MDLNANDVDAAMKIIEGTARSMGITRPNKAGERSGSSPEGQRRVVSCRLFDNRDKPVGAAARRPKAGARSERRLFDNRTVKDKSAAARRPKGRGACDFVGGPSRPHHNLATVAMRLSEGSAP